MTPNDPTALNHEQDQALLRRLRRGSARRRTISHSAPLAPVLPIGDRISDLIAAIVGSWRFILLQSGLLCLWILVNLFNPGSAWDPYPFILLNLVLSFQAAYTAPIIMMSQNRQADIDRQRAASDYDINVKAELEIELLHQKIDLLREQEILALTRTVGALVERIDRLKPASALPEGEQPAS